jgi:integrase
MRKTRKQAGSVVMNRRSGTWHFLWRCNGRRCSRRIGSLRELPTKRAAWRAAEAFRHVIIEREQQEPAVTVGTLIELYRREKMPERLSTRRAYESWLYNHVLPRWADAPLTEMQAREVELWLNDLPLAPKSKSHIRALLSALWDYAMWSGNVPVQRNPISLVTVKGATMRKRQPRSLTVEEFRHFAEHLQEPLRTLAIVCVCFGLRISECLALKWGDVDWLNSKLQIERGIVRQCVDDVKTINSGRTMSVDAGTLQIFAAWKATTQFGAEEDWIFASSAQIGRLPLSYTGVLHAFQRAAINAGIGALGTHALRHTYRSWLDAVGTSIAVQQKLMRHADIRTTMNVYGDVVTDEMTKAQSAISGLALNGLQVDCKAS